MVKVGPRARIALLLAALFLSVAALWLPQRGVAPAQALPLPQGWNLIADPNGIMTSGPAYTLQMSDTTYETVAPGTALAPGLGYWVYGSAHAAIPLASGMAQASVRAPAGRFVMVGDPSSAVAAKVSGADFLLAFNATRGYYDLSDRVLSPGQGAFAVSLAGGTISLTAEGSTSADCSTLETGSACPINGACPQGYPVAVTQDALAFPPVTPGQPPLPGPAILCFNALSQALSAGYTLAPSQQLVLSGPQSVTTDNITITILSATLESPQSFVARVDAGQGQLCSQCSCCSAATAILTVEYQLDNINGPPTAVNMGQFMSVHLPQETVPAAILLAGQHSVATALQGVSTVSAVSGIFTATPFNAIDTVDWQLNQPLFDTTEGTHGLNVAFELNFRGPFAGQIIPAGGGNGYLPPFSPQAPGISIVSPTPASLPAAPITGLPAPTASATPANLPAAPTTGSPAPLGSATPAASATPAVTPAPAATTGPATAVPLQSR